MCEVTKCCLCGKDILQPYGNNPEPVKHEGLCCDECNIKIVVPARLNNLLICDDE